MSHPIRPTKPIFYFLHASHGVSSFYSTNQLYLTYATRVDMFAIDKGTKIMANRR
jgi:hypothetical protein